jgi:hypothetical protein
LYGHHINIAKFNLPLLDEGDTQAVEKSGATGQEEVNGLKVGDEVTVQVSTVVNTTQLYCYGKNHRKGRQPQPDIFYQKA